MIMAELHGKIGEGLLPIDRSEDALTSNIFGCLRYLTPNKGLIPFINEVFRDNDVQKGLDLSENWKPVYYFWPEGVARKREPDVLISLSSDKESYAIVVEAKYYSGPSDKEEEVTDSDKKFGNQLSDEFIDLLKLRYKVDGKTIHLDCPLENCYLLYLTSNISKQIDEINSAVEQYELNFHEDRVNIRSQLLWTNWTKVWTVLKRTPADDFPDDLIRNDLLSLLERKGFKEFSGFTIKDRVPKYRPFYGETWFQTPTIHFYENKGSFFKGII